MGTLPSNSVLLGEISGQSIYYYIDTSGSEPETDIYSVNSQNNATLIATYAGTSADIVFPETVASNNGILYFSTLVNDTFAVYATNGTSTGTQTLLSITFSATSNVVPGITSSLTLGASELLTVEFGNLWTVYGTKGTTAGTKPLFSLNGGRTGDTASIFASSQVNGREIYIASFDNTYVFYGTDGTVAGTAKLLTYSAGATDPDTSISAVASIDNRDIYVINDKNGNLVYGTDGTAGGTALLFTYDGSDTSTSSAQVSALTQINGSELLLATYNGSFKLYATDGTSAGTHLLCSGAGSDVSYMTGLDGQYYFTSTTTSGSSLYVTNLSFTSASLMMTVAPGSSFSVTQSGTKVLAEAIQSGTVTKSYWVNPNNGSYAVAGAEYTWSGPVSGQWNVASNWDDLTTGANPASVAPGSKDSVTFNSTSGGFQVIGGTGDAAYLLLNGNDAITGTIIASSLVLSSGTYIGLPGEPNNIYTTDVEAGATLSATWSTMNGASAIDVSGAGSSLIASGTLSMLPGAGGIFDAYPTLSATDGAFVQLAKVVTGDGTLAVDSTSMIKIGSLGAVTRGAVTVEDGATVTGDFTISGNLVVAAGAMDAGATLDASGTVSVGAKATLASIGGGSVTIGNGAVVQSVSASTLAVIGSGAVVGELSAGSATIMAGATVDGGFDVSTKLTDDGNLTLTGDSVLTPYSNIGFGNEGVAPGTLTGAGTIQIAAGVGVALNGGLTGTLDLVAGKGADLTLWNAASTDAITLSGSDILTLETLYPSATTFTTTLGALLAPITGFDVSDVLLVDAAITSATYIAGTAAGTGELVLDNGTNAVTTLTLEGTYTGEHFLAFADGGQTEIVIAPTTTATLSAGSAKGDNYSWVGPVSGVWNAASNWDDTTAGANPAAVAPGSKDSVTFNSTAGGFQVIGGTGDAAYLLVNGDDAITGTIITTSLVLSSGTYVGLPGEPNNIYTTDVEAGATLSATSATISGASALSVSGVGSLFKDTGTLDLAAIDGFITVEVPALSATDGAILQLANLVSGEGDLTVDSASSIKIGSLGMGTRGAVTVEDGATVSGDLNISGNLLVIAGAVEAGATLDASGAVSVGAKATLASVGGGSVTIGNSAVVQSVSGSTLAILDSGAVVGELSAGSATIMAGATVNGGFDVSSKLTDDGSLTLTGGSVLTPYSNIGFGNYGVAPGTLTGAGTVQIAAGIGVALNGGLTGTLDLVAGKNVDLTLWNAASTDAITLSGSDILTIETLYPSATVFSTTLGSVLAPITGFDVSDVLLVDASVTSATYVAGTAAGAGELILDNGTNAVTTITLEGHYLGNSFFLQTISSNETEIGLSPTIGSGGTIIVAAGESLTNSLIYSGAYEVVEAGGIDNTPTLAGGTLAIVSGATIGGDISFTGTGSTLSISLPADASTSLPLTTITGFTAGDTIQLTGVPYAAGADSYTIANPGTVTIDANGTFYSLFIAGETVGQQNLNLSGGSTVTLTVAGSVAAASTLQAGVSMPLTAVAKAFVTAIGGPGSDTITATAAQQTLSGGAGIETLIGYAGFGDTFVDTAAGLNGDTIRYFGGSDLIDITNLARSGANVSYAGNAAAGTLSISESGLGVVDTITFTSGTNLSGSLFHMTNNGSGGTYLG